jgi:hypothetical protein
MVKVASAQRCCACPFREQFESDVDKIYDSCVCSSMIKKIHAGVPADMAAYNEP